MLSKLLAVAHLHRMEHVLAHTKVLVLVRGGRDLKNHRIHCCVACWVRSDSLMFNLLLNSVTRRV